MSEEYLPPTKRCPFCGGEPATTHVQYARETVDEQGWKQSRFYYCYCIQCHAAARGIVGARSPTEAVERWDRRVPMHDHQSHGEHNG